MLRPFYRKTKRIDKMTVYVISTMSSAVEYCVYGENPMGNVFPILKSVLIKGGANVIDGRTLLTPNGVETAISDEDFELLKEKCEVFRKHLEGGYLKVVKSKTKDMDKAVSDMKEQDKSAQLKPADLGADEYNSVNKTYRKRKRKGE